MLLERKLECALCKNRETWKMWRRDSCNATRALMMRWMSGELPLHHPEHQIRTRWEDHVDQEQTLCTADITGLRAKRLGFGVSVKLVPGGDEPIER